MKQVKVSFSAPVAIGMVPFHVSYVLTVAVAVVSAEVFLGFVNKQRLIDTPSESYVHHS